MADASALTQELLDRLRAGDRAARDELFAHVYDRLRRIARKMLRGYLGVRRWDETDDVLQDVARRILKALDQVTPATSADFFGLAARHVRFELLTLARRYAGSEGLGARHQTNTENPATPPHDRADSAAGAPGFAEWCEFHVQVGQLPEEERQVVDLLFYQGLKQAEAAGLLGVTVRTVQRRWQAAILRLHDRLGGERPGA